MKWYVLQFTSTRFNTVFRHLENMSVAYFCPRVKSRYRRPDNQIGFRKRLSPLFPGYVFILADFNVIHSSKITAIPWVQSFIAFGGEPLPVKDEQISELMRAEQSEQEVAIGIGVKSISHRLAGILLEENADKRSVMLLSYLTE